MESRSRRPSAKEREKTSRSRGRASHARESTPRGAVARGAFLRDGGSRLEDEDLLALVLASSAHRTEAAKKLAGRILDQCGGLAGLAKTPLEKLLEIRGVDRARAGRILAALEFSRRAQEVSLEAGQALRHPADAVRTILSRHAQANKEVFGVLMLDVKNRPRGYRIVSVGTLDQSLVHPREVFKEAVASNAAKIVLFHNHPSGDPTPSAEDVDVTKRLASAGHTLGIPVLDHIIVAEGSYVSLKEKKLIP